MPSRSNHPWVRRIYDLLEPGEPVAIEDLMQAAIPLVPPGMAWRSRERGRLLANRSKGINTPPRQPDDRAIFSGARRLVRIEIGKIKHRGGGHYLDIGGKRYFQKTTLTLEESIAAKSRASKAYWSKLSGAERQREVRRRQQAIGPEARRERTRKGWITRRMKKASLRQSSEQPEPSTRE